jgi:signal transduction histidine kinase
VASQTSTIIVEGRDKIAQLRHTNSRTSELAEVLAAAAPQHAADGAQNLKIEVLGRTRPLTVETHEQLASIGIEAIRNAYRHSGADRITATPDYHRSSLRMIIADNGRGLGGQVAAVEQSHFGLMGMRERAVLLGAKLSIESNEGRGTTIKVSVPRQIAYSSG